MRTKEQQQRRDAKQLRRLRLREDIPPQVMRAIKWIESGVRVGSERYNEEFVEKVRRTMIVEVNKLNRRSRSGPT